MIDFQLISLLADAGFQFVGTTLGMTRSDMGDWPVLATTDKTQIKEWLDEGKGLVSVANFGHALVIDRDDKAACAAKGFKDGWLDGYFGVDTPSGGDHWHGLADAVTDAIGRGVVNVYETKGDKKSKKILELKLNHQSVCAPTASRIAQPKKVDGTYAPKASFAGTRSGLHPNLLAWLDEYAEPEQKASKGTFNDFHPSFELIEFLENEGCSEHSSGMVDGALHVIVEMCPHCGKEARHKSTVRAGITKFIFGGNGVGFVCQGCGINTMEEHQQKMEEIDDTYEPWDGVIYVKDDPELEMAQLNERFPVEEAGDDPEPELPQITPQTGEEGRKILSALIDEIMRIPERPSRNEPEFLPRREKHRAICKHVYTHMKKHGKFFNVGNCATWVSNETRRNVQVIKKGQEFLSLLATFGVLAGDPVAEQIGKFLDAACYEFPHATIRLLSYYDKNAHVLYANEYGGNYLKITETGVERKRNGDDGILFDSGEGKCDPLEADLGTVNTWGVLQSSALAPDTFNGLIKKEILDVVHYADDGVGHDNAHMLLMGSILALYFPERLSWATPLVVFTGVGGSMKSALVKCVGRLLQGSKFDMTPTPDSGDIQSLKDICINYPFVGLDEANRLKGLSDILKVIATGGTDSRRVLYTTSTMQERPYQARLWMTMNTGDPHEETVSSRMLIIDAAPRSDYRATIYLGWSAGKRNEIWTELVMRLQAAMSAIAEAERSGEANITVNHRMSDFFVFLKTLSLAEFGYEERINQAMLATASRQGTAVADAMELTDLLAKMSTDHNDKWKTAKEWGEILSDLADPSDRELRKKCRSKNSISYWFRGNERLLTERFGLRRDIDKHKHVTKFMFTKFTERPIWLKDVASADHNDEDLPVLESK